MKFPSLLNQEPKQIKVPPNFSFKRIKGWASIRREQLRRQPECQVCGTKKSLAVHHITPVYIRPDLEAVETNMITLCENPKTIFCHFTFGHLGNWKYYNDNIIMMASEVRGLIASVIDNISQPNPQ
jgi:hypothetical protein